MTTYKVNGKQATEAAFSQAFAKGKQAASNGEDMASNPYATEMEWNGRIICPTIDMRNRWNDGFNTVRAGGLRCRIT